MTGLIAIKKSDFFGLGMFQDPTGGWPNWDDVDFGYRAVKVGFYYGAVLQLSWSTGTTWQLT